MKNLVIGILAHVDAGKTTLSEGMLYTSGGLRKLGRVDDRDSFLDNFALERVRGITIFSKQAILALPNTRLTLLDTPGHVDFSAETERSLQVLDYAVLVISGADGVQAHTRTLWSLLKKYRIPVFLFVNKMDQPGTDRNRLLSEIKQKLSEGCVDFTEDTAQACFEEAALTDDTALEEFLDTGRLSLETMQGLIKNRLVFPCLFGSALKLAGVDTLLERMDMYMREPHFTDQFGARVYKIARDTQGNRLTYMKITGGTITVRDTLHGTNDGQEAWEEKVTQLRIYSGEKFETVSEVKAGTVCAALGLTKTSAGEGLGSEEGITKPFLEPVLNYRILFPEQINAGLMLPKLKQLEEEDPLLHIEWQETSQEIHARVMGEVQMEVLQSLVLERFGVEIGFGTGDIVYKETIRSVAEGVGHFEPLRHYAEVHLLLEPGEPGSGLSFRLACSEDLLAKNWQRLVLTHLQEKKHCGVLIGAEITDMKLTLVAGKAHLKHTEGGDFRQASYRAVRQGLMQAESVLLEPVYEFRLELPADMLGRAMTDIERLHGTVATPQMEGDVAVLRGTAPVVTMQNYQQEVNAYTKGQGRLSCSLKGYELCHNMEEVIEKKGYDPEADVLNPTGSVFCAHGSGFLVPWNEVKDHMQVESYLKGEGKYRITPDKVLSGPVSQTGDRWLATEEVDAILTRTSHANARMDNNEKKGKIGKTKRSYDSSINIQTVSETGTQERRTDRLKKEEYLLVDGYNIIYAWPELKELVLDNVDGARGRLLDKMCNYQAITGVRLIVVFDAYRVKGHQTEILDYHNIHVVFTKEAETADRYIERFTHENNKKYRITVATSDGLEQIIIRGAGSRLLSAGDLLAEMKRLEQVTREEYIENRPPHKSYLLDGLTEEFYG